MSVLNPKTVADLRSLEAGGAENFFADLIDLFIRESRPKVEDLRKALAQNDAKSIERLAHTLKGSTGNLGADSLSKLCSALQTAAHAGHGAEFADLTRRIGEEYALVEAELLALRKKA